MSLMLIYRRKRFRAILSLFHSRSFVTQRAHELINIIIILTIVIYCCLPGTRVGINYYLIILFRFSICFLFINFDNINYGRCDDFSYSTSVILCVSDYSTKIILFLILFVLLLLFYLKKNN